VKSEPVPPRLIETVLGGANSNVAPARRWMRSALPMAASIAIVCGVAGYWLASRSSPGDDLLGGREIAAALGNLPSGSEREVRTASGPVRLKTVGSYRVAGGLCRTFELTGATQNIRGVGCSQGANWLINVAVARPDAGSFVPASSGESAIDAFLDAVDAQGPLSAEEEAKLGANAH